MKSANSCSLLAALFLFLCANFVHGDSCLQLADEESLGFNKRIIEDICRAEPADFSGLFVELDSGNVVIAVPSSYRKAGRPGQSMRFFLRRELVVEAGRFYSIHLTRPERGIAKVAQFVEPVEHEILSRAREQCGSRVSVNRVRATAPGMKNPVEVLEAKLGDNMLRTDGNSESLLLALIDTSRRLGCPQEN